MADIEKLIARADPVLARIPRDAPSTMAEIGTYAGDLACYLLERRPHLTIYCIDSWIGREGQPEEYQATGDVHAVMSQDEQDALHKLTQRRLRPFPERAHIRRQASPGAAAGFSDESFDLVFVDGDHSAAGTLADLRAWWPKVRSGGWLGGHDYGNRDRRFRFGIERAVSMFAEEVELQPRLEGGTTYWFAKP